MLCIITHNILHTRVLTQRKLQHHITPNTPRDGRGCRGLCELLRDEVSGGVELDVEGADEVGGGVLSGIILTIGLL